MQRGLRSKQLVDLVFVVFGVVCLLAFLFAGWMWWLVVGWLVGCSFPRFRA